MATIIMSPDGVAMAARNIEGAAADLLRAVQEAPTHAVAMRLWQLVRPLERDLDAVCRAAGDRADTLLSDGRLR